MDAFLAAELGIIGSLVAAYGITAVPLAARPRRRAGRTENVLATATTRTPVGHQPCGPGPRWAWRSLTVLVGLAVGLGHALSVGEPEQVWRLGLAATARIPAAWVMVGLAVAIWGFWPRLRRAGLGARSWRSW